MQRSNFIASLQRTNANAMPPMPALAHTSWRVAFVALAIALFAQTTFLHGFGVRGGTVSLVLLVVLWFAASAGPARGMFFGLIAGACEDAFAGGTGAAWTVATPLAAGAAAQIVRAANWDHPLFLALVGAVAAAIRSIAFWLVQRAEHPVLASLPAATVHAAAWSALLDALVILAATACLRGLRPPRVDRR